MAYGDSLRDDWAYRPSHVCVVCHDPVNRPDEHKHARDYYRTHPQPNQCEFCRTVYPAPHAYYCPAKPGVPTKPCTCPSQWKGPGWVRAGSNPNCEEHGRGN
jgi:hypothetical protein